MAKIFYYDSVNMHALSSAAIKAGTLNGSLDFTASDSAITNEHAIKDMSITAKVSSFQDEDAIRIDFGSDKTVTHIASYNAATTASSETLIWYHHTANDNAGTSFAINSTSPVGWDVVNASSQSKRYWYVRSSTGTFSSLSEVIMGVPLEFEVEPDIGGATQEIFATDLNTSFAGDEYAIQKHDPISTWSLSFKNISQTFRNNLITFEQNVTNFKKFLYYDGSTYNYVRLSSPIRFVEIAFERYSCTIELREQLS